MDPREKLAIALVNRAVKPARKKALAKLATQDRVPVVDGGWGWRGAKPGEISGTEYVAESRKLNDAWQKAIALTKPTPGNNQIGLHNEAIRLGGIYNAYNQKWKEQLKHLAPIAHQLPVGMLFQRMELSGIPREYTGKLLLPVVKSSHDIPSIATAMKPLDHADRLKFIDRLEHWKQSPQELADMLEWGAV